MDCHGILDMSFHVIPCYFLAGAPARDVLKGAFTELAGFCKQTVQCVIVVDFISFHFVLSPPRCSRT